MVVLDKSSSMQTGTIGGVTKWSIAVSALGQVMTALQDHAEVGLMTFPRPDRCGPGGLDVAPALNSRSAILSALGTPPPQYDNFTPMAQTLEAAALEPTLVDADAPRYVILISDGWQWCSPYDPATRFDGVTAVGSLNAQDVTTYVVGFGGATDASALNQMAVDAGTARMGCNPANDEPADPNQCYYQADNSAALIAALAQIATEVSAEICDGEDNDCDGLVDEGLVRDCASACGTGTETCDAGSWSGCTAPEVGTETCNGLDDDCDGAADPGCECTAGDTRPLRRDQRRRRLPARHPDLRRRRHLGQLRGLGRSVARGLQRPRRRLRRRGRRGRRHHRPRRRCPLHLRPRRGLRRRHLPARHPREPAHRRGRSLRRRRRGLAPGRLLQQRRRRRRHRQRGPGAVRPARHHRPPPPPLATSPPASFNALQPSRPQHNFTRAGFAP